MNVSATRVVITAHCHERTLIELLNRVCWTGPRATFSQKIADNNELLFVIDFHDADFPVTVPFEESDFVRDDWNRMRFYREVGPPDADEEQYREVYPK